MPPFRGPRRDVTVLDMAKPIADVNALMRAQHGAIHHRQASDLRLTDRRIGEYVADGVWVEAHPLVYVAGGTPPTFATRCAAALLAVRHSSRRQAERRLVAVARLAAAYLHGFDVAEPARIDLLVPSDAAHHDLRGIRVVRARTWQRRAFGVVDGLNVTSVPDTIVDIGLAVPRERLHAIVQEAAFTRPGLPLAVARACRRGRPGSANARRAAALVAAGVDSSLHATGKALLRAAGVKDVECGVEVVEGAGPSDCVIRDRRLVIEWDGDAHRVDRGTFLHDREKDRLLRRAGYVTLRYTAEQVRRRTPVIEDVRTADARAGPASPAARAIR